MIKMTLANLNSSGATFNAEIREYNIKYAGEMYDRLESYSLTIMRAHWEKLNRPVELMITIEGIEPPKEQKK